ncbi:hypothetical protein ACRBEV_06540 [Methylobacterium phyllosphaerae]
MVTATAFEEDADAARTALQPLDDAPVKPLSRSGPTPLDFEQLFDASGALFPEEVRARVEATYSNHSPGAVMAAIQSLWRSAPSETSVFLLTIFCGPNVPRPQRDMARSISSRIYGGPWTMWRDPHTDQANSAWHRELIAVLKPFNIGYYIGETNTVEQPDIVAQAFTPEKWQRLCDLRDRYDPDRVFFDYFDGLAGGSDRGAR